MSALVQHPSPATKSSPADAGSEPSRRAISGRGGGYEGQVQRLAPRENLPGLTLAGVTLSAQATGATFAALERALGNVKARQARAAAAKGAEAVLALFAPDLPAGAQRLPAAHEIADAYAQWAVKQPPIKADAPPGKKPKGEGEGKEGGGPDKTHNIDVGDYGLMVPLEAAIGHQLAQLCPVAGRSVGAHIKGACSVEGVYLGLALELKAANSDDGFEVEGAVTLSLGIGETNANIAINEKLGVKGHGDDAVEAMHMAGLAIEHFMREQQFDWQHPTWDEVISTGKKFLVNAAVLGGGPAGVAAAGTLALAGAKIADALWGKNFERDIALQMDEDDYGEHSVGVGIGISGEEEEVEMGVAFDYTHSTKVKNVNGAIGSESEDALEGSFELSFDSKNWSFGLSGHLGGTFGGSHQAGFKIEMARKEQVVSGGDIVADLIGAKVRGLAQKVTKRAGGLIGQIADGMAKIMNGVAAAKALAGSGGLELTGEYDSAKGVLTLTLVVTHKLVDEKANEGVVDVEVSFELGQEVATMEIPIDPPK